jgi:hypothetical protein
MKKFTVTFLDLVSSETLGVPFEPSVTIPAVAPTTGSLPEPGVVDPFDPDVYI